MDQIIQEPSYTNISGIKVVSEVPTAQKDEKVSSVLKRLKSSARSYTNIGYIYVLDKDKNLEGVASIRDLLAYPATIKISEVMKTGLITVQPDADKEKVADLAVKHNIKAVPVVQDRKFIGVVPMDEILSILNRALRKDILHLAGIHKAHLNYENSMEVPVLLSILHRLPWLLIGLLGITIAAIFISAFDATLQQYIILSFFLPAIVYMSSALGTQHQTLFIRDLAIIGKELNMKLYVIKQMFISIVIGLVIVSIIYGIISIFWHEYYIALIIAISMYITLVVSSFTALLTTIAINKMKLDPALGSGPLATIISDVTSIVIYFSVAYLLLGL